MHKLFLFRFRFSIKNEIESCSGLSIIKFRGGSTSWKFGGAFYTKCLRIFSSSTTSKFDKTEARAGFKEVDELKIWSLLLHRELHWLHSNMAGETGGAGGLLHHLKFFRWCIAPTEKLGEKYKNFVNKILCHLKKILFIQFFFWLSFFFYRYLSIWVPPIS